MHHQRIVALEQPVVEIDDAADEAWRENPHAAVVEEIDAGGRPVLIEHRVIAEMRIAVNHAKPAEREPPRGEHGRGDAVARGKRGLFVGEQACAIEPVESEEAPGR